MGYNQRKKANRLKQQWNSVKIQQGGAIVKPGKGCRQGNNKPKILTRKMKKALAEYMQEEDQELLELQEKMLDKLPTSNSKKSTKIENPKAKKGSSEVNNSASLETEEAPMEM